jgi:hypothetical protein
MTFDDFYIKYMTLLFEMSKSTLVDTVFLREELNDICAKYPDYESEAQNRIWLEVNKK